MNQEALDLFTRLNTDSVFMMGIMLLMVWTMIWKGFGLWRAAQEKSLGWFISIMIFNTLGVLEILYLWIFSKQNTSKK